MGGAAVARTPAKSPQSHGRSVDSTKRTRPTFGRVSPQLSSLYDCPSLLFARTGRSLELYSRIYADLNIYARIYAKLKTFITRRAYVVFDETWSELILATR